MSRWVEGNVKEVKKFSNNLFKIIVENAPIDPFLAGQFTKIAFQVFGQRYTHRAYSYVNSPESNLLEFYISKIPNGRISTRLYNLEKNSKIILSKKSYGNFTLESLQPCKSLWMVVTGTAIGPCLSILRQKSEHIKKFHSLILVHAVRYKSDLNYQNLMQNIVKRSCYKNIKIQYVISRENISGALLGRIPKLLECGILEKHIGITIKNINSHVMLCGNPGMIRETKEILKKRGMCENFQYSPGNITVERYW